VKLTGCLHGWSWVAFGASMGGLGPLLGDLCATRPTLAPIWAVLGRSRLSGPMWAVLGYLRGYVGALGSYVGFLSRLRALVHGPGQSWACSSALRWPCKHAGWGLVTMSALKTSQQNSEIPPEKIPKAYKKIVSSTF